MDHLAPCFACRRHVRASDRRCPFCGEEMRATPPPRLPTRRLGRAAIFAFGTAIAAASGATGCGDSHLPGDDAGATRDAGPDAALAAMYGGVPVDSGVDSGPEVDAGPVDVEDAGPGGLLYGGAPED